MKIKIKDAKPGLVIKSGSYFGFVLFCKTSRSLDIFWGRDPYIFMIDAHDSYYGPVYQPISDVNEKVKVITGKKRERILNDIRAGQRKHLFEIQENLRLVDMILTKE